MYCLIRGITAPTHLVMALVDIGGGSEKQNISVGKLGLLAYFRFILDLLFYQHCSFSYTSVCSYFGGTRPIFAPWVLRVGEQSLEWLLSMAI